VANEADSKNAEERGKSRSRRLVVVLPSTILIMLPIVLFGTSDAFFTVRMRGMYWVSLFSGPLATWIEFSFQTTHADRIYALFAAFALLAGIVSPEGTPEAVAHGRFLAFGQ